MSKPPAIQTDTTPAPTPGPWVMAPVLVSIDGVTSLATVRLAALVPWLMQTRRVPFVAAVRALYEALAGLEGLTLYIAQKSGLARAVGASDAFGLDTPVQGRRIISRGIDRPPVPTQGRALPDGVSPGVSAALYAIRHGWGSGAHDETILDREDFDASRLVMRCDQAAALWGSAALELINAKPITAADIKGDRNKGKNDLGEWTEDAKKLMRKASSDARTAGKSMQFAANEFGLTRQAFAGAIKREKKRTGGNLPTASEDENPATRGAAR